MKGDKVNKCIFMGRLTRNPDIRYGNDNLCIARFNLAVDRIYAKEGQQQADFLQIVAFGKLAEFAETYLRQGIKVVVTAKAQSGSYTNKDGVKVYYTKFAAQEIEFAESKGSNDNNGPRRPEPATDSDGFMSVPEGAGEDLPFNYGG